MIGRAGQPAEVARAYLILPSELWSYMTGAASWLSTKGTLTTTNKDVAGHSCQPKTLRPPKLALSRNSPAMNSLRSGPVT